MATEENKSDPSTPEIESNHGIANFGKVDYRGTQALRFYANHCGVSATLFDVKLTLNDVDVDIDGGGVRASRSLAVLMSPELAQLLYMALGKTLDQYATNYGKTRLPESVKIGGVEVKTAPQPAETQQS